MRPAQVIGQTLAHYRITGAIGVGGMGEVYRARDTTLDRDVAIKILPAAFAQDAERLARFEREARLLASLNHPLIAHVYGFERAVLPKGGFAHFLAMELAEGEDLAERLKRGPVPVDEAVAIAKQIAEALEEAHEKGIVHRDLKPANVKVTAEGKVKVLDFGLAKAYAGESVSASSSEVSRSPTLAHMGTQAGVILGTAAYMSPEQARGKPVDKRADIWAFGVVLFEMLAGRRLFDGETVTDVLAAVVKEPIDWTALPASTPRHLRRLLGRCLERDPKLRLRDIGEARLALDDTGAESAQPPAVAGAPPVWRGLVWVATAVAIGLVAAVAWRYAARTAPVQPLRKFSVAVKGLKTGIQSPPAISPDGRRIVYVADADLWVRDLDRLEPRRLAAGVSPIFPFWSPDSSQVAYIARQKLWRVSITGGEPTLVADAGFARGGTTPGGVWLRDGTIVFAPAANGTSLIAVPSGGGQFSEYMGRATGESDFHKPSLLPDGESIVFVVDSNQRGADSIDVLSAGKRRTIVKEPGQVLNTPVYSPSGHLLFVREGTGAGYFGDSLGIWAVPFSLDRLQATGPPFPVAPHAHWPTVSDDGTLIYAEPREPRYELVLLDGDGRLTRTLGATQPFARAPVFSPDGRRLAASENEGLFVHDLARGTRTRLTFDKLLHLDLAWTPAGDTIVHSSRLGGDAPDMVLRRADGGAKPVVIGKGEAVTVSPDGKWVLFQTFNVGTAGDLFYVAAGGGGKPLPFLEDAAHATGSTFSPDGRFVAYASRPPGDDRRDVFVRPFPPTEGVWQVSSDGGDRPRWSRAGDRIFYARGEDLMEVEVRTRPTLSLGSLRLRLAGGPSRLRLDQGYDVSPDGRSFAAIREVPDPEGHLPSLIVVESWSGEMRK